MQQWWWRAPYRPEEVGDGLAQQETQAVLILSELWMRSLRRAGMVLLLCGPFGVHWQLKISCCSAALAMGSLCPLWI